MLRWLRRMDWPGRLVLTGILLTLASALISQWLISGNMGMLLEIAEQEASLEQQTKEQWDVLNRQEQRLMQTGLIHMVALDNPKLQTLSKQLWSDYAIADAMPSDVNALLALIETTRGAIIDHIDTLYIRRLTLQQRRLQLEHANQRYGNIAFVLQMLGLILVVSRDLARPR